MLPTNHQWRTQVDDSYIYPDDSYKNPDDSYKYPDDSYKYPADSYEYPDDGYKYPDDSYSFTIAKFGRLLEGDGGDGDRPLLIFIALAEGWFRRHDEGEGESGKPFGSTF